MRYSQAKANSRTKFFKKADKNSAIVGILPDSEEVILIDYATQGLNDEDWYWRAMAVPKEGAFDANIHGYVLQDDIIF
jgi:hypothetical protein